MVYRRTDRVARRLAARHDTILAAALAAAAEGGMAAVQIAPVAERAGIAAGTVYRYFPSKSDLIAEMVRRACAREIDAMRQAAAAAPGPLSAVAAAMATFSARALQQRRLSWALLGEPVDVDAEPARNAFRRAIAAELERLVQAAVASGLLPSDQARGPAAGPALVGALLEGLVGPLAPAIDAEPAAQRQAVQTLTLLVMRALGVADARARGLVVQTSMPPVTEGAA
jgi:AcrR family transcriptional regulator